LQTGRFKSLRGELAAAEVHVPMIHANNSAALLHQPDTMFNMVRPGLLVYGIAPLGRRPALSTLQRCVRPALSWKCRVSLVKDVAKGAGLSYGLSFVAPRRMRVATLTAGYGDGYLRAGSNRAFVLIRGRRCRVIGNITMDQMLADVSRVPKARAGDEAVLIGWQGKESITAAELASWFGTIPWEVLTNITYRVPRIYRGSSAA
jgi:alanine racemase